MSWRNVLGSAAVHVVAFMVLFLVSPPGRTAAVPSSISVNLVNLPRGPVSQKVTMPEPEEAKSHGELEPERTPDRPRDRTVKLDDSKPGKPAPRSTPGETTSGPAALGAGISGEVGVDDPDFEFTYYLIALRNRIGQNWSAPAGLVTSGQPVRAVVYFRVGRNGTVTDARLEQSSRVGFFDQSALRAVVLSNPLPPLPLGYGGSQLGVHFSFEYTGR